MSNSPEKLPLGQEHGFEAAREAGEQRHEQLRGAHERVNERSQQQVEKASETARSEALENAISVEKRTASPETAKPAPATRRGSIKAQRDASYKRTMHHVQTELSGPSRTFSKVIHTKAVEKTSEVLGATIARPNAIAVGAFTAFIATLALYIIARHFGYPLSGFETMGAFIAGWVIGLLFDFLRVMITGKRS